MRIPDGYWNYDLGEVETLPEQSMLRLIGYDFARDDAERAKLEKRIRHIYQTDQIRQLSRSQLHHRIVQPRYKHHLRRKHEEWSKRLKRPLGEIIELANFYVDMTDMNYEDVDYLFHENHEISPNLIDVDIVSLFDVMKAIREGTGITMGRDLGSVLRNCPEIATLNPMTIMDRKDSFFGWGFEDHALGDIIRYAPRAFLEDDFDVIECKVRYILQRICPDYEMVAACGVLNLDLVEAAAKYEFLYRRGQSKF